MDLLSGFSSTDVDAEMWHSKQIKLEDLPSHIPNGSTVYISSTAATPEASLNAIVDNWNTTDIQIVQILPGGDLPHMKENIDRIRTLSFFSYSRTMFYTTHATTTGGSHSAVTENPIHRKESLADYKPMSISSIGRLLREQIVTCDVAIIKVTEPHKGFCSLGFGVDCTLEFVKHASVVIAEVSNRMPWTEGPSKIPISAIDYWIEASSTLKTTTQLWPDYTNKIKDMYSNKVLDQIGLNVAKKIPDGATLKFDWNPFVHCVCLHLGGHKNLGLHTDIFVDGLYRLQLSGVINNSLKTIDNGRSVISQAHGSSPDFYDFLDRNPAIEVHPSSYVNDPKVLAKIHNLVVIIVALKIDVTGQVTTDSIGHKFFGGIWSTSDSINGVKLSQSGMPIVILPSRSRNGNSNIVFDLPPGTGISITRSDIEYVVTEYGVAYLYGKSIRERCLALIEIAHPDFRTELFTLARQHQYLSKSQPGFSFQSTYPAKFESDFVTKKTQRTVFIRPIKAADEDLLRRFFHELSDHSVYLRYFRRLRSMSHQILQKYTDLDYSNDMALLVLYPKTSTMGDKKVNTDGPSGSLRNHQQEYNLVGIGQWISDRHDGVPEIAFQVRDDWQGEGIGTHLFLRLTDIASSKEFPCSKFKADVLAENRGMRRVFESSNIPYTTRSDFGVITYIFDLPQKTSNNTKSQGILGGINES